MKPTPRGETKQIVEDWIKNQHGTAGWEQKLKNLIVKVEANSRKAALLYLLAFFNDYDHPIQMDAEYVREQIIKFMREK